MVIYPDASAIVALFRTERHSERAQTVLSDGLAQRQTSDFTIAEVSAALTAEYRGRQHGAAELARMLAAADIWFATSGTWIAVESADVRLATAFVRRLDLKLRTPDAIHLAICRRVGATLLTFDTNQAAAATALGIPLAA